MDRSRVDRLLNAEDPQDAVERGVTYEFLERLLRKQKLSSLTTRQVVKQYVVPQTFNSRCSLSGLLRQIHPQSVGRATHYVVHPWDGSFERLVSALGAVDGSHDDEEGNPPYFWIDVFALNQRQQVEGYKREDDAWLHRDEMFSQLRNCMRTIDKICVIVDPVTNPIVLKRAWCMFECAQALHQSREVMLCPVPEPPDCDPFLQVVYDFEDTISHYAVKFPESDTTIPIDKEWLEKEVLSLSPLGTKWLDEQVSHEFLGWLGDRAAGRVLASNFLESTEQEPVEKELVAKRLFLMQSLSKLLASLERAAKAREILEKAVARAEQVWGTEEESTLSMKHDLACLCAKSFGELKKSDQQLRAILALRLKQHDEEHELVVQSMEALGRVLKERRKLTEAISLFKKVLAIREKTIGRKHFETLVTLNLLALTLQKREHYKEAEHVFRRVVSTGIETLGATNLDVMVWSNNLAVLYQDTKQYDKAEVLLRTTLRNAEHALGPTHQHTLTLVFNLGYCLWGQGRMRAAEGFFRRELASCEATKGPEHRDTQRSRQNLARLLQRQAGREKEAEAILRGEVLNKSEDSIGSTSPQQQKQKPVVPAQRRVAISNPEVAADSPVRQHGHLLAAAAGLSALPPPRGVGGPRKSSAEWNESAALPRELSGSPTFHQRGSAASPISDGDDRTADDTTGEDRSQGKLVEAEEEEIVLEEYDEEYLEDDLGGGGGTDDGGTYDEDEEEYYGGEDGGMKEEQGSKEDYSEEEDVVEYEENSINDSVQKRSHGGEDDEDQGSEGISQDNIDEPLFGEENDEEEDDEDYGDGHGRGRGHSRGRERREQTVTSDDELLVSKFEDDEDDEFDVDGLIAGIDAEPDEDEKLPESEDEQYPAALPPLPDDEEHDSHLNGDSHYVEATRQSLEKVELSQELEV